MAGTKRSKTRRRSKWKKILIWFLVLYLLCRYLLPFIFAFLMKDDDFAFFVNSITGSPKCQAFRLWLQNARLAVLAFLPEGLRNAIYPKFKPADLLAFFKGWPFTRPALGVILLLILIRYRKMLLDFFRNFKGRMASLFFIVYQLIKKTSLLIGHLRWMHFMSCTKRVNSKNISMIRRICGGKEDFSILKFGKESSMGNLSLLLNEDYTVSVYVDGSQADTLKSSDGWNIYQADQALKLVSNTDTWEG